MKPMNENRRILLVDDDPLILSCYERLLGRRFNLDVAMGAAEALQRISRDGPYAVVISDMKMPGMTGLELLTKTKETSPGTVRLLLSGNAEFDGAGRVVREGIVFRVLQKPCPIDELIEILESALVYQESVKV